MKSTDKYKKGRSNLYFHNSGFSCCEYLVLFCILSQISLSLSLSLFLSLLPLSNLSVIYSSFIYPVINLCSIFFTRNLFL